MPTAAINFIMIANGANEEFNIGDVIKHCVRSFVFQNHTLYFYDFGQIIAIVQSINQYNLIIRCHQII